MTKVPINISISGDNISKGMEGDNKHIPIGEVSRPLQGTYSGFGYAGLLSKIFGYCNHSGYIDSTLAKCSERHD